MLRNKFSRRLATLALLTGTVGLFAQAPLVDIDRNRHGNLWAAQKDIASAYEKVDAAQVANDSKLGGHAGKAKELLAQASRELKLAAEFANRR